MSDTSMSTRAKAAVLDYVERAGWTAGQVFFATLLGGTVLSVADLHWGKAAALAGGAFGASAVLTWVQRRSIVAKGVQSIKSPTAFFWVDLGTRLLKTFVASLAGLFAANGFNVATFAMSAALDTAALATLAALSKGLLARGSDTGGLDPSGGPEPATRNPSTMPTSYYVAAVRQEDVAPVGPPCDEPSEATAQPVDEQGDHAAAVPVSPAGHGLTQ
jgi:hypothetical protein